MIIVLWNKDMRRRKRWLSSLALNNWNIVILFLVCRSVDHWKTLEYVKQCCSKLALAVYSTVYFWTSSILISKTCFIWQKNILTEKKTYLCLLSWFSSTWPIIGDFPGGLDCKASVYNVGDLGSIPGSGRSPGEGNGNPLQYYCLENPKDRGAW